MPSALKLARGNPGHRPINTDEPELELALTAPPKDLKGVARAEWVRLATHLVAVGVLTVGDTQTFKTYCELVELKTKYQRLVRKVGAEASDRLGYTSRLLKLQTALKQHAAELGLTPSSRAGVRRVKAAQVVQTQDKRAKYFGNRSSA